MLNQVKLEEPLLHSNIEQSNPPMGNKQAASRRRLEQASHVEYHESTSEDELMANAANGESKTTSAQQQQQQQRNNRRESDQSHQSHHDSLSQIDPELRAAQQEQEPGPSYWTQIKTGYAEAVNAIIRPPRARYSLDELGPPFFTLGGLRYHRTDFCQRNKRGMQVQCSWWQPIAEQRVDEKLPCVVYMHGNSSCRGEAVEILPMVLELGCTLMTFDFCGCGMSDGDFISLGWYERDDAEAVVEYLRASGTVSTIGLWGRR